MVAHLSTVKINLSVSSFGLEWQEMIKARKRNKITAESNRVTLQKQQYNKLIEDLKAKANADLAPDGDIDATNDQLEQEIKKYQNVPGAEGVVQQLQSMIKYTEESIRDKTFKDQWDAAIARGEAPTVEEVMKAEVSDKLKADYVIKAKKEGAMAVPTELMKAAKTEIKDEIENRVGWNINTNKARDPKINRAIAYALQQYKTDYRAARLDDKSDAQAHDYALGRFQAALGTDKYKGTYAVGNTPDNMGGLVGFGRDAVTEVLNNPAVEIKKKLKEIGPSAIDTPLIPKAQLEAAIKNIEKNGMYDIPPQIRIIQNNTNLSAIEIMQRQINAHGLQYELPQYAVEFDTETQNKFSEYKDLLNKYNNTTRTDIAMIGGGEDPIYTQATPMQEKIKAIFSSRESPNAGYDAINAGTGGDRPGGATRWLGRPLTSMTVGEVKYYQNLPNDHPDGILAAGKYQFIPGTLEIATKEAGITDDMLFSEAVQDRIFFVHLNNYGAHQPWEKWWIQQGGPHLALTAEEKRLIETFRNSYDPSKPWRQPKNMNPAVVSKAKPGGLAPLDLEAMGISTVPIE